jgi:hypothetical protein
MDEKKYFQKHGAAGLFLNILNQSPSDIAGKERKWQTLMVIINHFMSNLREIEKSFITEKIK